MAQDMDRQGKENTEESGDFEKVRMKMLIDQLQHRPMAKAVHNILAAVNDLLERRPANCDRDGNCKSCSRAECVSREEPQKGTNQKEEDSIYMERAKDYLDCWNRKSLAHAVSDLLRQVDSYLDTPDKDDT